MNLNFSSERWQSIRGNYRARWAGELDRPLINLTISGRDPGRPQPALPARDFASFYDLSVTAEEIADRWLYDLECRHFPGDAFPHVWPNFGPGVIAAFLGLELQNGVGTVWFHQPNVIELKNLELCLDPDNLWFRRVCHLYSAAAERYEGLVHLGMTDLGGNLDIVQAFRPGERLALDLFDVPDAVDRAGWRAHEAWWNCFNELNRIIQPAHPGYTCWTPLYSEEPSYMLQCDFAYMISREMFDQFVKPELVATCRKLANPFHHLDGVGQLKHLDSLLQIPELKGVQWVPGAGKPGVSEWPEVYRKIREAGKCIQFFTSQDPLGWRTLEAIINQSGSGKGIVMIGDAPAQDECEVRTLLKKFEVS
ncbi:MAG: hypothetical protein WCQ21_06185 [Verrucomicrobiota bacterium]|jgi:hypothetical protein